MRIEDYCIHEQASLLDAMRAIDAGAASIAVIVDEAGRLLGVATDGDIRRCLLSGVMLDAPVSIAMNRNPIAVPATLPRFHVVEQMRRLRISSIPQLANDGTVIGLHTMLDLVGRPRLPNTAVVMAGGRGTRLGPLTKSTPKPLIEVAGVPIIEWIILGLLESGIENFIVSLGYLGSMIRERLKDGRRLGAHVTYIEEDPAVPRGTAGSLSLLPVELMKEDADPVLVTNGDLIVNYDAAELIQAHKGCDSALTIATRTYSHQIPFGALAINNHGCVMSITEKPTMESTISAGIYIIDPIALKFVPKCGVYSMPDFIQDLLNRDKTVATWGLPGSWQDVGTPAELAKARGQS